MYEYENDGARCSITGGYVYRASAIPALHGSYLFSDFCDGTIQALQVRDGAVVGELDLASTRATWSRSCRAPDLELYVVNIGLIAGTVFRIDPAAV